MEDLTVEQVVAVHSRILEGGKGDHRVISEANLHQMVFRANLIQEIVPRAAFIFYFLCAFPTFREGNFRTALVVTRRALADGGYEITANQAMFGALADGIRGFSTGPEETEQWFCNNTRKSLHRES